MRVRYSFSSRKTRRTKNISKQRQKYPLILKKIVNISDIILEVLDARFIKDTRNLEVEELIKKQNKKIIYVLNKSDLVNKIDKDVLKELNPFVILSATKRNGGRKLRDLIKKESRKIKKLEEEEEKIIVGVIGYPNTGKSSLINLLIGKSSAKTGADAGFTKGLQKLKLNKDILLLDSPGVIPDKQYSGIGNKAISRHTKVGARSHSQVRDPEAVVATLVRDFPGVFENHYNIESNGNCEILLENLGRKYNFLKKGNEVDFDKASRKLLKDWQEGIIRV